MKSRVPRGSCCTAGRGRGGAKTKWGGRSESPRRSEGRVPFGGAGQQPGRTRVPDGGRVGVGRKKEGSGVLSVIIIACYEHEDITTTRSRVDVPPLLDEHIVGCVPT